MQREINRASFIGASQLFGDIFQPYLITRRDVLQPRQHCGDQSARHGLIVR